MQGEAKGSRLAALNSLLLIAILTIVVIQFVIFVFGGSEIAGGFKIPGRLDVPGAPGEPYSGEIYTVVPMDPGTSGLFGRAVLTNKQTGESWIIFPKGSAYKVSLPEE